MAREVISLTPEEVNRMLASGEMKILNHPGDINYAEQGPEEPWPQTPETQKLIDLGYTRKQAAYSVEEITDKTKVYVGPLVNKDGNGEIIPIFKKLKNAELILTPEGKMRIQELTIGGMNKDQLILEIERHGFRIDEGAKALMDHLNFAISENHQNVRLIKLPAKSLGWGLGYQSPSTYQILETAQILERATLLGLDFCQPKVGPYLRLQDTQQPFNDWYWVTWEPFNNLLFNIDHDYGGKWLRASIVSPSIRWVPKETLVFSLPN